MTISKFSVLGIILAVSLMSAAVQASLLISPTRLTFAERERSKDIVLINTSSKAVTYRLEWEEKKARPQGGYQPLTAEEQPAFPVASSMLRFSPRQVTLQAGERQTIKIAARKPSNLAEGEYRSFLMFKALPPKLDVGSDGGAMSVNLNLILSYSMPVIVRHGKTDVEVSVQSIKLAYDKHSKKGRVNVALSRRGSASAHLNVLAYWTPATGGKEKLIARTNAFNVYPELENVGLNLSWLGEELADQAGTMRVVLEGAGEYSNRLFDDTKFLLAPWQIKPLNTAATTN